jgi:ubiquinone biosynthesis protein
MERLAGFAFDDAVAIKAAGIDTHAVIRTGMIAFLEGAMIHGIFHGDLHGGNLFVMADGRTAMLDFGITARLTPARRTAFLKMLLGGMANDVKTQIRALMELGALPMDTDIDQVITDLRLNEAVIDPTTLSGEELVAEVQRVVKAMLGYGAKLPKELMLYVKNLLFLDGAMANLAPDIDLFATLTDIAIHFASSHGQRIIDDVGMDLSNMVVDITSFKASIGVDPSVEKLTYSDLQERRALIAKRMDGRQADAAEAVGLKSRFLPKRKK